MRTTIAFLLASATLIAQGTVSHDLLLRPTPDSWPMYNGDYSGRRFSPLTNIDTAMQQDIHARIKRTAEGIAQSAGATAEVTIITNNPGKRAGIEGYGLTIVDRVSLEIEPNERNLEYLRTKKEKLGHVLHLMG